MDSGCTVAVLGGFLYRDPALDIALVATTPSQHVEGMCKVRRVFWFATNRADRVGKN